MAILVEGTDHATARPTLEDPRQLGSVIKKIEEIQQLPEQDRNHLFYLLDNVLQNVKAKKAFAS